MPEEQAPASPQTPPPAQPTPAAAPAAAPPPTVPLTIEEYQRLRGIEGQMKTIQAEQAAALQVAEDKRLRLLADKEGAEKALGEQRTAWEQKHTEALTRYTQLEQGVFAERKGRTFAEAMAGREFYGETDEHRAAIRQQVAGLLDSRFEVARDASGSLVVREKTSGMPAEHVLPKLLDSVEFAHFFKAKGKGGTIPPAGAPYNPTRNFEPGSLEDVADQFKRGQGQYPSFGLQPIPRQ